MLLTPTYAFLQFTSACNSRCQTCHLWERTPETIPLEALERIGLFIDPARIGSVYVTGGEPLLHPNVVEVAAILNRWKPGIRLIGSTNGLCPELYLSRVKAILDAGITIRFQVSLNGLPDTHDKSRGVPGNYAKAVETARKLKAIGVLASLNILPIEGLTTHADREHVAALARTLDVPGWSSPILRHNEWFGESNDGAKVPLIENCRGGTDALTIRYNGDITACQETHPNLVFGNLRDEGLDAGKVVAVQEFVRMRKCQPCGCCTNAFTDGMYVS
jgi:MoaA/NifB/PqqE/SkfB family radical SAM enzyme